MKITYSLDIPTHENIEYLDNIIKGKCHSQDEETGVVYEIALNDLYEINWIKDKETAEKIIKELRRNKVYKPIMLDKNIHINDNYCNCDTIAIYIHQYDDEMCIKYDCLKERTIFELIEEYPEIEVIEKMLSEKELKTAAKDMIKFWALNSKEFEEVAKKEFIFTAAERKKIKKYMEELEKE